MILKTWAGEIVHRDGRVYVPKESCATALAEKDAEILRLLDAAQGFLITNDSTALSLAEAHGKLLSIMGSVRGKLGKEWL